MGDLITLSAAGRNLSSNWAHKKDMGIIVQISSNYENPYQIRWIHSKWQRAAWYKQYELKFAKPDKK
tara:strand:+ start:132 stop:332 length:201 start_codon:yes stop_codon:yes gene_type:complete